MSTLARTVGRALPFLFVVGCFTSVVLDGGPGDGGRDAQPGIDAAAYVTCGEPGQQLTVYDFRRDPAVIEGCERFRGTIDYAYASITDASQLSSLRAIDGSLNFFWTEDLVTLRGLERLERVGGRLVMTGTQVQTITELGALREVGADLVITYNPRLTSLAGLEQIQEVERLYIEGNPLLTTLRDLRDMRRVRGDARFSRIPRAEVDAFLARVEVGGTIEIAE